MLNAVKCYRDLKEGYCLKISTNTLLNMFKERKWVVLRAVICFAINIGLFVLMGAQHGAESTDYFGLAIFAYLSFVCACGLNKLRILNGVVFWLVPVINFFIVECFRQDPFENMQLYTMLFNILLYYLVFLVVLFISKNNGITVLITSITAFLIGFANYIVVAFRENPILPWDLLSVGTGLKVVSNYTVPIKVNLVILLSCFVTIVFFGISILKHKRNFKVVVRAVVAGGLVVVLIACSLFAQSSLIGKCFFINESMFEPASYYNNNGYAVGFLRALKYLNVDKPNGYSAEEALEVLNAYNQGKAEPKEYPNIIVIMNESFSDLSVLGDFTTNKDYMPYFSALKNDTIKGNLHVSVKGGNTANSEFEFLTGNSMAFLPTSSIPYQQFIKGATPSLASYLKEDFGYTTYAIHPYHATAWNRNVIYPMLGFDKQLFLDDFAEDTHKLRRFASDAATYDKIIELYENREKDERFFSFCVTLQNHGGFDLLFDNFEPTVTADGLEDDVSLTQYLSLIKESDDAFKDLVEYFEGVNEPTVILMFGDHQPTDEAIKGLLDKIDFNTSDLKEFEKQYITPFAIWTNYDIEEKEVEYTSCNYLSSLLLDTAGLPLSPYQNYLKELQSEYPVITSNCMIDKNGNYFSPKEFLKNKSLIEYSKLQYYKLFDS